MLASQATAGGVQPEIGIGDDAAAWRPTPGRMAIQTTDLLIEDVHFSLAHMTWYDVGWKAMAVNVSDIAAMGGVPRAAFVSVGLPAAMTQADARDLFVGIADCSREYKVAVLGGDTVASPSGAVVNVALYGESLDDNGEVLRRDRARVDDAIAVSGPLGASAAYLQLHDPALQPAHAHPRPRVDLGQQLLRDGIRCGMDISDGLVGDLGKLCQASGVGAVLEASRVPVPPEVTRLLPDQALELALAGGEDYELLVCGQEQMLRQAGLTLFGRIVAGNGVRVLDRAGAETNLASPGYDAFRQ